MQPEMMALDVAAVRAVEDLRCKLISAGDIEAFGNLLCDDYQHVHITGRVDDKMAALASFAKVPRQCWREDYSVRILGDIAIAAGAQTNRMVRDGGHLEDKVIIATVVLQRRAGKWLIVHFHACAGPR